MITKNISDKPTLRYHEVKYLELIFFCYLVLFQVVIIWYGLIMGMEILDIIGFGVDPWV